MPLAHDLARSIVYLLPSDLGLWRLRRLLPSCRALPTRRVTKLRGFPLRLTYNPHTYSGWYLFYRGIYEEGVVKMCCRLLKPGMTFVDAGANVGLYSMIAAHVVGPSGTVIAIEPQQKLAALVAENAKLNSLSNIVIRNCALGESTGRSLLHQVSWTNDGAATLAVSDGEKTCGDPVPVNVETLSTLLSDAGIGSVGGMKIDVEGAELSVLEGFRSALKENPPEFILLEAIDRHLKRFHASSADLIALLHAHDYDIACLHRGRWRRIDSAHDHERWLFAPDLLAVHRSKPVWRQVFGA